MQIVDNHRGGLSRPFLGHGDIFWKSYDENQIWSKCVHARGSDAQFSGAKKLPYKFVFVITFRNIVPSTKNWYRKTRLAILCNLRENSGTEINY